MENHHLLEKGGGFCDILEVGSFVVRINVESVDNLKVF